MIRQAVIVAGLVCLVLLLAACGTAARTTAPTTTEGDHLGRYAAEAAVAKGQAIDPALRRTILSEPALRFPARIGLARLETGTVSAVPQGEAEAWLAMVQDLGPGWGELVPIGPLEVALAAPQGGGGDCRPDAPGTASPCDPSEPAVLLGDIRRAAVRQRLDAVLIYEVVGERRQGLDPAAVTDLAPVSNLLRLIAAGGSAGHAQGVLMDARHGAVYGFAAGDPGADEVPSGEPTGAAVAALARETGTMLRELRIELAEARAARAEAENRSGFRPN